MSASSPVTGLAAVPRVSGMGPGAWGHRFGPQLCCEWCAATWNAHQATPRPCLRGTGMRGQGAGNAVDAAGEARGPRHANALRRAAS